MKRGEIIYQILDFVEDYSLNLVDLVSAILKSGYGASMSKIDYEHQKLSNERENNIINREKKRDLQNYLNKLKIDGLIQESPKGKIRLSLKGKSKLKILEKRRVLNKSLYKKEPANQLLIVSYDIPIAFNKERAILREILKVLGFNLVHKSVWVGKTKLPKKFINALSIMKILKFVEILEVTKSGSLKKF